MVKMRQFYIYKFKSGRLKRSKFNIKIDIADARVNNELVAFGDSQFLRTIRKVTNHPYKEEKLKKALKEKNKEDIDKQLLIPDYVSIVIEHETHYDKMIEEGLFINGKKYVRFSCSASNARVNTVFFINEDIFQVTNEILKNGARKVLITKAKWNAYFSLLSSATYEVREPRVCVIPDYEVTLNHEFDFINDDTTIERKMVEIKEYPPFDGEGIIDINFSKRWAEDLGLDYVPSQYCIRNAYIKGMVATMPLHEYALENNIEFTIEDVWKKKHKISELDIILTASQFKLWNAYDSWEEYRYNCIKNNIGWGVSKTSPKEDKKVAFTNYQFIQALNIDDRQIEDLCNPTIEWLKDVSGMDVMKSLLFMLGKEINFESITDLPIKALLLDNELINDTYIKNKIIRMINKKIRQACAGKLLVDGNFSVMVSDPYALMQFICGNEVTGLLKDREHYSGFWNKRNEIKTSACRSPLTWRSEVNILNLIKNEETERWYRYQQSGIIYNIYGDDTMRHADSDFDMDIVFTTNKKEFNDGAYIDEKPITYNKKTVQKVIIDESTLHESDKSAFNSKIGFITNCDTTMYELQTLYSPESVEYKELYNRLRYSRKLQGDEIDRAKGVEVDKFPSHWTDYRSLDKESVDYELNKKLLIEKRPYFMRYVYEHYNKQYKTFLDDMENYSQAHFLCSYKENKNENFIKMFVRKSPLLVETNGVMNKVSRYVESKLLEINRDEKLPKDEIIEKIMPVGEYDEDYAVIIKKKLKEYKSYRNKIRKTQSIVSSKNENEEKLNNISNAISTDILKLEKRYDALYTAIDICYKTKVYEDKEFVWDLFGEEIVETLLSKVKRPIYIPVLDKNGSFEYLGDRYKKEELII